MMTCRGLFYAFAVIITVTLLVMELSMFSRILEVDYNHVRQFSSEDIVQCIEGLQLRKRARNLGNTISDFNIQGDQLHIAFVGDSRVRQHFFMFSLALPPQDLQLKNLTEYHGEMEVSSEMLNLLVTFSWRPNILGENGDSFVKDVKRWLTMPASISKKPDIILLGMALHDMLIAQNTTNHVQYQRRLFKLRPLLEELSKRTRLIWLSSYPTYDAASIDEWRGTKIFSEVIYRYNAIAREIFRGSSSAVYFWESSTVIVSEYLRSCAMNIRSSGSPWGLTSYFMCEDYIHPGSAVLTEAMHMFLSEICVTR